MAKQASIKSIEAVREFKTALTEFLDRGRVAMSSANAEVQKTMDWLKYDQMSYWQRQARKCEQDLNEARVNLYRKQLGPVDQQQPHREEKELYERAKRRLERARQQIEKVQYWIRVFEREATIYRGQVQPMGTILEYHVPSGLMKLEQAVVGLERYLALQAPNSEFQAHDDGDDEDDGSETETDDDGSKGDTAAGQADGTVTE